jgi:hypothetical protein
MSREIFINDGCLRVPSARESGGAVLRLMCTSNGECVVGWKEVLPASCPPTDAANTSGETVYRLVKPNGPTEADFSTLSTLDPAKHLIGPHQCRARAVSVCTTLAGARGTRKLPTQKGKRIGKLTLSAGAGVVKQTGQKLYHVSWWRCGAFDAPASTVVEIDEPAER